MTEQSHSPHDPEDLRKKEEEEELWPQYPLEGRIPSV
jgi:hypothetical protein